MIGDGLDAASRQAPVGIVAARIRRREPRWLALHPVEGSASARQR